MKYAGFTLIEILIVILIISIVSSIAVLTISHNQNKRMEYFANDLADLISLAEEEAMLRPAVLGLVFTKNQFQFYEYQPAAKKNNLWVVLGNDPTFHPHDLPSDIKVTLKIEGQIVPPAEDLKNVFPALIISGTTDITPFIILIGKKNGEPRYQIKGNANGMISADVYHAE